MIMFDVSSGVYVNGSVLDMLIVVLGSFLGKYKLCVCINMGKFYCVEVLNLIFLICFIVENVCG